MSSFPINICHVVAMPYPGRGHINPMMNICKQLSTAKPDILVTFVVTEEWLGFIGSDPKPANVRFRTIPNAIPSEIGRANDGPGFLDAVSTKMGEPFENLLDRLEPGPTVILADNSLVWITEMANRKNIPLASLWVMPATVMSILYHFDMLRQNNHFPADPSERGDEIIDYIPGVASTRLADLPTFFNGKGLLMSKCVLQCMSLLPKAQYLIFPSFYELEPNAIDAFSKELPLPVYPLGPCIPYLDLIDHDRDHDHDVPDYIKWLDSQPRGSVLYISLGSFLSVSGTQMDEILNGVRESGVRYLAVLRKDMASSWIDDGLGMVVPWCDQLRVLCHPSIGGFWSHCGFSSALEAVFAGVIVLTFPIFWDQIPTSKAIVEDWKIGWRARKGDGLVTRGEIAELLRAFMDDENEEVKEMRKRATKMKEACRKAIAKGGSSHANIQAFVNAISPK